MQLIKVAKETKRTNSYHEIYYFNQTSGQAYQAIGVSNLSSIEVFRCQPTKPNWVSKRVNRYI